MAIHAFGAVVVAEMRSAVRLVRTRFFVVAAIVAGLGIYAAQAVFHRILWASAHLVTPPRFLIDTIGTVVLTILAVGTVALAFDHRVRDRTERIAEALDTRPHSNLALVAGRLVGIVGVVWLAAVFLALVLQSWGLVASVFQWPVGSGMEPVSLVVYLFLDALPTLVFWCALTLMLAAALRFRLAALLVTLSLLATHLWIATNAPLFLHDAVVANLAATHLPSDAAPVFPDGADLLLRAALLAMAIGFVMVAADLYPRPDGRATTPRVLGGIGFAAIGVVLIAELVLQSFAERDGKTAWVAAHEAYRDAPRLDLETVSGVVRIDPGRRLTIDVELALANPQDRALQRLVFSLNPGLEVEEIHVDGVSADYQHEKGLLTLDPPSPLAAGGTIDVGISANGVPDPRFAYLDSAIDNSSALPSAGRWRLDYHLPLRGVRRAAAQRNNEAASRREMAVRSGAPRFLTRPRGVYPIKVTTIDQDIPADFDASNGSEGWNPIGVVELNAPGEVHVVVSLDEMNQLTTPVVIADAVRWLKLPDP